MAFACSHLLNHTLGIQSLAAMEPGGRVVVAVWRAVPATLLLYAAFALHGARAVHKLWRRRSLKMPRWEMAQVVLGFLIPFWLVVHIIGTRGSHQFFGVDDAYAYVLNTLWPDGAARQSLMLVLVWLHGCLGIHFWLRLRPWYRAVQPSLFAFALLLPTPCPDRLRQRGPGTARPCRARPGLAGASGRSAELARPVGDGVDLCDRAAGAVRLHRGPPRDPRRAQVRTARARYGRRVRLRYPDGVTVSIELGMSVLEASRTAGVPHASVCGGRGRCSTCRVRVGHGGLGRRALGLAR